MWQKFKELLFVSPFVTGERRALVCEWFFHNIVVGFAGVWLPLLALLCLGIFNPKKAILDGEFVVFAVTVSAVSVGYFVKEGSLKTRRSEIITYVGLMSVTLLGVLVRTVLALTGEFGNVLHPNMHLLAWLTLVLVVAAIVLNFRLFAIQLDLEEKKENPQNPPPGSDAREISAMTDAAKKNSKIEGVQL